MKEKILSFFEQDIRISIILGAVFLSAIFICISFSYAFYELSLEEDNKFSLVAGTLEYDLNCNSQSCNNISVSKGEIISIPFTITSRNIIDSRYILYYETSCAKVSYLAQTGTSAGSIGVEGDSREVTLVIEGLDSCNVSIGAAGGFPNYDLTVPEGTYEIDEAKVSTVSVSQQVGGTITLRNQRTSATSTDRVEAIYGDTIIVTASLQTGYGLVSISYGSGTVSSGGSFQVGLSDITVVPTYQRISYSVSVTQQTGGTTSVSKSSAYYGDSITITASPSTGYQLSSIQYSTNGGSSWTTISGSGNTRTLNMPASNIKVRANYSRVSYSVRTTSTTGGTISVSKTSAYYGDSITVTASPSTGYSLSSIQYSTNGGSSWTTISGSGNSRTFSMPASSVTVRANYTRISYSVGTTSTTGGTIRVSKTSAYYGDSITITASPSTGYQLSNIQYSTNNGSSWTTLSGSGNSRTLSMPASNIKVRANYTKITYTITVKADNSSPMLRTTVQSTATYGDNVCVKVSKTASYTNYGLGTFTVNGTTYNSSTSGTCFSMPASNITIAPVPSSPSSGIEKFLWDWYNVAFGRTPDQNGWDNNCLMYYTRGTGVVSLLDSLTNGVEYKNHNYNNTQLITHFYRVILGRTPDSGGLNTYLGMMNSGTSKKEIAKYLAESSEGKNRLNGLGITNLS